MEQGYGRWPESVWQSNTLDWKKSETIVAGIDVGTTSSQAVILCDGELFGYANIYTGSDFPTIAEKVLQKAIGDSGMTLKDISAIGATGFGRKNVAFASGVFDEITCHGKGARFMFGPTVSTIVDLGAQNTKAIRMYEWDRLRDFKTNDKCATGMGRSFEMMSNILQVPIEEFGEKSLGVEKDPEPSSTTCFNFAFPETYGLIRQGFKEEKYDENEVLASYAFAVAWRILGTIGKLQPLDIGDISVYEDLAFTGGLAKNVGVTKRIEKELNVSALSSDIDPQLAGAIGAALQV